MEKSTLLLMVQPFSYTSYDVKLRELEGPVFCFPQKDAYYFEAEV
jgi:hypothetical protein